ncbi:MAG TPA: methyltransferase domain-containing protein [Pirellulales bacterium]|jgi:SAM-dependent methyltransferase|nr:methyltransferase domain-containing protein [Pirellulales bacterium]
MLSIIKKSLPRSVKSTFKEAVGLNALSDRIDQVHDGLNCLSQRIDHALDRPVSPAVETGPQPTADERRTNDELMRQLERQQDLLRRINLDLFRAEMKQQDERHFQCANRTTRVEVTPHEEYPHTYFAVTADGKHFRETLLYSHLGLAKLITEYDFQSILDVGSGRGTSARVFRFLGKDLTTVDIQPAFDFSLTGDYLDMRFPGQFDAIWISHVLEHQRHLGKFLEKLYADLREGGVLAVTVPSSLSPMLIGHCNIFTPMHMIYNLVLAGFDCREARLKCYDWQFTVLVRKKSNGIKSISFASIHTALDGTMGEARNEPGLVPNIRDFFPIEIPPSGHVWGEIDSLNWD